MLAAAEAKAVSFEIAYNIAIVDAGGHLVAFVRQDGAFIGSIDLAIDKGVQQEFSAKLSPIGRGSRRQGSHFSVFRKAMSAKFVMFGGGIPIISGGRII